jgi:hypothetical protein
MTCLKLRESTCWLDVSICEGRPRVGRVDVVVVPGEDLLLLDRRFLECPRFRFCLSRAYRHHLSLQTGLARLHLVSDWGDSSRLFD